MGAMLRVIGFAVLVFVVYQLLRFVPVIGRSGFLLLWISVILVSVGVARVGSIALDARRMRGHVRALGAVDSPHNRGKLGSLLLGHGRARQALPHLEAAAQGEPDYAEWSYRHGLALLELGRTEEAIAALRRVVAQDEEYAYGAAQLRLARALRRTGAHEQALAALETFERNHGPSPESAFRRGQVLRALGRRDEARQSLARVGELASQAARYQRTEASGWALRAALLRWI